MTTVLGEIVESAPAWKVGRVSKFKKSLRPDGSHHVDVGGIEHRNQQSSTPYSMFSTVMVLGPMKIIPSTFEFGFVSPSIPAQLSGRMATPSNLSSVGAHIVFDAFQSGTMVGTT